MAQHEPSQAPNRGEQTAGTSTLYNTLARPPQKGLSETPRGCAGGQDPEPPVRDGPGKAARGRGAQREHPSANRSVLLGKFNYAFGRWNDSRCSNSGICFL